MPQQGADGLERNAGAHQAGGRRMPEQIGALRPRLVQPRPLQRVDDEIGDRVAGRERAIGCPRSQKHSLLRNPRPCVFDIGQNRVADLLGQGQGYLAPGFAAHLDQRIAPIDVRQSQLNDVSRAQGEPCQEQEDRAIANADGLGDIAACDHPVDRLGGRNRGRRSSRQAGAEGTASTKLDGQAPLEARNPRYVRMDVASDLACAHDVPWKRASRTSRIRSGS